MHTVMAHGIKNKRQRPRRSRIRLDTERQMMKMTTGTVMIPQSIPVVKKAIAEVAMTLSKSTAVKAQTGNMVSASLRNQQRRAYIGRT
jgi:hypothetical protein